MSNPRFGTVTADTLNVRPTPSTDQPAIAQLHKGDVVPVLADADGWYQISLTGGGTGYVSATYLSVEDSVSTILFPDLYMYTASGKPDWSQLTGDARYFGAIIKGLEGTSYPKGEPWFLEQWPALRAAGGDRYGKTWFRGCYHYLMLQSDGAKQAESFLATVEKAGGWGDGDLPPIADVERGSETSSNHGASKQQVEDCAGAWAETIRAALGGTVLLYGRGAMRDLGITSRMGFDHLWAPQYNYKLDSTDNIGWPSELVKLWQYSDGKTEFTKDPNWAPGIGPCDMSKFLGSLDDLRVLVAGARK